MQSDFLKEILNLKIKMLELGIGAITYPIPENISAKFGSTIEEDKYIIIVLF